MHTRTYIKGWDTGYSDDYYAPTRELDQTISKHKVMMCVYGGGGGGGGEGVSNAKTVDFFCRCDGEHGQDGTCRIFRTCLDSTLDGKGKHSNQTKTRRRTATVLAQI